MHIRYPLCVLAHQMPPRRYNAMQPPRCSSTALVAARRIIVCRVVWARGGACARVVRHRGAGGRGRGRVKRVGSAGVTQRGSIVPHVQPPALRASGKSIQRVRCGGARHVGLALSDSV